MILKKLSIVCVVVWGLFNSVLGEASSILDIKVDDKTDKTKVIIIADKAIGDYKVDTIDEIPQIVVDIKGFSCKSYDLWMVKGAVLRIQTKQVDKDTRIIIKLIKKEPYKAYLEKNKLIIAINNPYYIYNIHGVEVKEDANKSEVLIRTGGLVQEKYFPMAEPPRLFIDLLNATTTEKVYNISGVRINKVTTEQRKIDILNIARIIIELKETYPFEVTKLDNGLSVIFKQETLPPIEKETPTPKELPKLPKGKEKEIPSAKEPAKEKEIKEKEIGKEIKIKKEKSLKPEVSPKKKKERIKTKKEIKIIPPKDETLKEEIFKEEVASPKEEISALTMPTTKILPRVEEVKEEVLPKLKEQEVLISLDLKDADLLDILRLISHKAEVNIIPYSGVTGAVTLKIVDVPWEVALDMILKSQGFSYRWDRGVIRVGKPEQLIKEVETRIIQLNYAEVAKMKDLIAVKLTKDIGSVKEDPRTNSIIIIDTPQNIEEIEKLIKQLDRATEQVMIEAKIVKVEKDYAERLGFDWSYFGRGIEETENLKGVGIKLGEQGKAWFRYAKAINDYQLYTNLYALISENKAEILSNPKIIAVNNETAKVISGYEIPILSTSYKDGSAVQSVSFKEAGIKLSVKPIINPNKTVMLEVIPEVSNPYKWEYVEQKIPCFATEKAQTTLLIKDGETVVIGGIIKTSVDTTYEKVPVLGDLPVIGAIFKFKSENKRETELLIFLSVKIISA